MPQIATVGLVDGFRDDGASGAREEPAGFGRNLRACRQFYYSGPSWAEVAAPSEGRRQNAECRLRAATPVHWQSHCGSALKAIQRAFNPTAALAGAELWPPPKPPSGWGTGAVWRSCRAARVAREFAAAPLGRMPALLRRLSGGWRAQESGRIGFTRGLGLDISAIDERKGFERLH